MLDDILPGANKKELGHAEDYKLNENNSSTNHIYKRKDINAKSVNNFLIRIKLKL
jgi:hypothetical protein